LEESFGKFGTILEINIRERTDKFAFIEFKNHSDAEKAKDA
jgi:RNA recognition motif-containing protein